MPTTKWSGADQGNTINKFYKIGKHDEALAQSTSKSINLKRLH